MATIHKHDNDDTSLFSTNHYRVILFRTNIFYEEQGASSSSFHRTRNRSTAMTETFCGLSIFIEVCSRNCFLLSEICHFLCSSIE